MYMRNKQNKKIYFLLAITSILSTYSIYCTFSSRYVKYQIATSILIRIRETLSSIKKTYSPIATTDIRQPFETVLPEEEQKDTLKNIPKIFRNPNFGYEYNLETVPFRDESVKVFFLLRLLFDVS